MAICGEPNAGKSTLLNALLNDERAIVSDIPGTTRDVLEDYLNINGVTYRLIDTAGIRQTDDRIEKLGIDRAKNAISKAEIVLIVLNPASDIHSQFEEIIPNGFPCDKIIAVVNKSDIYTDADISSLPQGVNVVKISAKHKTNLDGLFAKISELSAFDFNQDEVILTNVRHFTIFSEALDAVKRAEKALESGLSGEFVSQDIRDALRAFAEITGDEITTDEVLGNIFKNFCIGK